MGKSAILSDMAQQIAAARYFQENEDWDALAKRVARALSSVEKDPEKWQAVFQECIAEMLFIPAGRILRNAGRPKGSLFNCYHLPIGDSIEEIGQFMKDSLCLWSEGGGVGVNFSTLRPKGDLILGKGGHSSGLVSFLEASDGLASTIESGGQRRAAGMASVDVSHPEVLDFIDSKLKHGKLSHYNISVSVNDDFLETVERDGEWEFKFNHRSFGKIRAREIWDKVVENMVNCAEPGLFNWSNMSKNNSYYYNPVTGTNPCLVGDTLILTDKGMVTIRQIVEDCVEKYRVATYNTETGSVEYEDVVWGAKTREDATIIELELEDGEILRLTPDHKVFTENRGYVEAAQLTEDDIILVIE